MAMDMALERAQKPVQTPSPSRVSDKPKRRRKAPSTPKVSTQITIRLGTPPPAADVVQAPLPRCVCGRSQSPLPPGIVA